ncbi:HepT-like ribonuclease domain-containing protein [Curtobacterium sp. 1P10AnD]|uniref:HepT-like ribonuclease domain-containing protein n=1 Tax=Curtobacterium sp. 1P10AnD TaxID=3132283 RepID=UPI0039A3DC60
MIHFDDLVGRLPGDRAARLPEGLSLAAVRRTRNILSHDYRKAKKDIVWDVIEHRIPGVILAVLD